LQPTRVAIAHKNMRIKPQFGKTNARSQLLCNAIRLPENSIHVSNQYSETASAAP
jgi:hypothetical protein